MKQEQKKLHKISAHFYQSATKIAQKKKWARDNKKLHTTKDKTKWNSNDACKMQIVGISAQSEKIAYSKHTCILHIIIIQ